MLPGRAVACRVVLRKCRAPLFGADVFRVEPVVTQPAPPQTRTCAINAYGSSVTRVSAPLWRITMLPCTAIQMLWMILGTGKAYVCNSFWNCAHRIGLL